MPAELLEGHESQPVKKRHGKQGYVLLNITVPPLMKSALVRKARRSGKSLNEEARVALARYLEER
jgi:predicted HicB family RNase H-like nuclease